jgi:hypothetical protein
VKINAQIKRASDFGFNSGNSTIALYNALTSDFDTILVDRQYTAWNIEPLHLKNLVDKVILFEEGCELKALPGKFKRVTDALLKLDNAQNVKLLGYGAGAVFKMNKEEYLEGEWRHIISLRNCKNIVIKGFELLDSGGDGLYISGLEKGTFSENITIENVLSSNNKRQGISIISVQNLVLKNSQFTKTNGTLPEAGIDIEPNHPEDRIVNVNIKNCIFSENNHSGIKIDLHNLTSASIPVSIVFENCVLRNNHHPSNSQVPAEITINANKKDPVKGNVLFKKCFIEESNWGILHSRKRSDAFRVVFKDCAANNICKSQSKPAISLEVPDYYRYSGALGGIDFGDFYISQSGTIPVFRVRGSKLRTLRLSNVSGRFVIFNTNLEGNYLEYIQYNPSYNWKVNLEFTEKSQ